MADPYGIPSTIDTVVLTTSLADYQKKITDNVYNKNVVLGVLGGNKRLVNGGLSIVELLIKEEQDDGGFYLGADVLNNTQGNDTTQVEYKWQNAYEPIVINRDEERQNSGDMHKIIDLAATKTTLSELAIGKRLEQALSIVVGGANNLIDLSTLVNTGVLGTINGGVDTFWQATSTTSGAFATQGLTDMTTATYTVGSAANVDLPTHYITTSTVFQKFEQTRLPLARISDSGTANAGYSNLTFKGKPVIYGNYIGAGRCYGLNMNYINLVVDSVTDMTTTPFISPTNQTVKVAYILWRGNLTTNNRRRHFVLTSIT